MNVTHLFFSREVKWRREDTGLIIRESWPGILLAVAIGATAFFIGNAKKYGLPSVELMKFIDPLVLSIVLGMLARVALVRTSLLPKVLPGIILAPFIFVPIGIALYGHQLRFDEMAAIHPVTFFWMVLTVAFAFFAIYFVSTRIFKMSASMANLLAVGSAVCGASAMAVVSPVVEAEPDELGTALVTNTLLVIASLFTLKLAALFMSPALFASTAGAVIQQTGFVHMAVDKGPLQDLAMLLKTTRVAFLIFIVPIVYYIVHRRLFFPWYMILFMATGVIYSTTHVPPAVTDVLKLVYGLIFATALGSIGLNANISTVGKRIWLPLLITYIVFVLSLGLFGGGEFFLH